MYDDILLSIDLNHDSSWRKALPAALELCRSSGATLHVMTVVPDMGSAWVAGFFPGDFEEKALARADAGMAEFVAENVPDGVPARTIVANGTIYEEILDAARKVGADLIVMASHRPEFRDYLLGPNASRVVRHAPMSVLVVREDADGS